MNNFDIDIWVNWQRNVDTISVVLDNGIGHGSFGSINGGKRGIVRREGLGRDDVGDTGLTCDIARSGRHTSRTDGDRNVTTITPCEPQKIACIPTRTTSLVDCTLVTLVASFAANPTDRNVRGIRPINRDVTMTVDLMQV